MRKNATASKALALAGISTDTNNDGVAEFTRHSIEGSVITQSEDVITYNSDIVSYGGVPVIHS